MAEDDLEFDAAPPAEAEPQPVMDYTQTLNYSQTIRKRIVDEFVGHGKIPDDPKELNVVLKALGDMDKTALLDRKNEIDQTAADSSKTVAEAMSEFITMQRNSNPFERNVDGTLAAPPLVESKAPEVDVKKLGEYELVEGEGEIGVIAESYTEFVKRMEDEKKIPSDDNQ